MCPGRIFDIIRDRARPSLGPALARAAGRGGAPEHPGGRRAGAENLRRFNLFRSRRPRLVAPRAARHIGDMSYTYPTRSPIDVRAVPRPGGGAGSRRLSRRRGEKPSFAVMRARAEGRRPALARKQSPVFASIRPRITKHHGAPRRRRRLGGFLRRVRVLSSAVGPKARSGRSPCTIWY